MVIPRSRSISMLSSIWVFHLAVFNSVAGLNQPVRKGAFAMINMGYYREIAYFT
jgi:hypothetical protein